MTNDAGRSWPAFFMAVREGPLNMVRVVYLARLRDAFGIKSEDWPLDGSSTTVASFLEALRARGGVWADELAPGRAVRVAVNHTVAQSASTIAPGDEVALLPPVTGG